MAKDYWLIVGCHCREDTRQSSVKKQGGRASACK